MSQRKKDLRPPWTPKEDETVKSWLATAVRQIAAGTGRPVNGVKKHIRKLFADGKPIFLLLLTLCLFAVPARAQDPNDDGGLTTWTLFGDGTQELRLGYEGLLPEIEFAAGGRHRDAPDLEIEDWSLRAYAIAHALDAQMVGQFLGNKVTLPDGNLYAGLFGEYSFDRDEEWSGGFVVGALIDWPKGWATTAEYGQTVFNSSDKEYEFMLGLRREF